MSMFWDTVRAAVHEAAAAAPDATAEKEKSLHAEEKGKRRSLGAICACVRLHALGTHPSPARTAHTRAHVYARARAAARNCTHATARNRTQPHATACNRTQQCFCSVAFGSQPRRMAVGRPTPSCRR